MKTGLIIWMLLLSCPAYVWAHTENTGLAYASTACRDANAIPPIDSLTFSVDFEDEDGIYLSPQEVAFSVMSDIRTDKQALNLICIITTDTYLPVDSLVFAVKPGKSGTIGHRIAFNPPAAGFYRISVYTMDGTAKSRVKRFNIGYNPEQIVSPPDAKPDFLEFWGNTRSELDKVAPRYKMSLLEDKSSDLKNMYHVEMYSLGNVKIEGYYSVPKQQGKYPAIIRYQGYGSDPRFPDPNDLPDFCELILSVRGQGIQKAINPYGEWLTSGLNDKDTYYYRGAYMDLVRGVDFLTSRPEIDTHNIMAAGGSQGGAFTLAVCALDKRIKAAAPYIPFLSDFRDYFTICPWPRSVFENYLKEHTDTNWEKIYDVLSYFDIKNLAGQITCPIIMGIGLQDEICPPHTNFAGYNRIGSDKIYVAYPNNQHNVGASWRPTRDAFFRQNLDTTPIRSGSVPPGVQFEWMGH